MRRYYVAILLISFALLQVGVNPADAGREAINSRAWNRYAEDMALLDDTFAYLEAVDNRFRCPVPGSTFVDSFGAPRAGHSHQGVDMMAPFDTPVIAPVDGTYRQHGSESFYLDGVDGNQYFGTHLGGHLVGDGPVQGGDEVALVSNTGNAAGGSPHLHFEIHPGGGLAVNPYPVVEPACSETLEVAAAPRAVTAATPTQFYPAPKPVYVFGVLETHRYVNSWRPVPERINRATATALTRYFNAVTGAKLRAYLIAISATSCSGPSDCDDLIRAAFSRQGIGWRSEEAIRVATCESGLNPRASNGGNYLGLFQQSAAYWPGRASQYGFAGYSAFNPWANANVSAAMVRSSGWSHWSCRP